MLHFLVFAYAIWREELGRVVARSALICFYKGWMEIHSQIRGWFGSGLVAGIEDIDLQQTLPFSIADWTGKGQCLCVSDWCWVGRKSEDCTRN